MMIICGWNPARLCLELLHTRIHTNTQTHMQVRAHTHTHTHTYLHTHTHIHRGSYKYFIPCDHKKTRNTVTQYLMAIGLYGFWV